MRTLAIFLLRLPVLFWRWVIRPVIGPNCRYAPSCSEYALEALEKHGPWRGAILALQRIGRCHPWGGHGFDPVPEPGSKKVHETPGSCYPDGTIPSVATPCETDRGIS